MPDDKKPQNMAELYKSAGVDVFAQGNSFGNFDYDTKTEYKDKPDITTKDIDNQKNEGTQFRNGNYNVDAHPDIMAGAEAYGKELLQMAKKANVEITDLAEFKNLKEIDGKVGPKEVGALVLAGSLDTSKGPFVGEVTSRFDDNISADRIAALGLDPKAAALAKEIARQLL